MIFELQRRRKALRQEVKRMNDRLIERYESTVKELDFFDMNVWLDPFDRERFYPAPDFAGTVSQLRKKGIRRMLITSSECIMYDAKTGNDHLERLIAEYDGVYGCLFLTPDPYMTETDLIGYMKEKKARGFIAARMSPRAYNHSLKSYSCGKIYNALSETATPLILVHSETSWDAVHALCSQYPKLNIIIEGSGDTKLIYHNHDYLALLQTHPNLYIESRFAVLYGEIESIVTHIGPDKLIFGTRFPYHNPAVPMSRVCFAEISDRDKKRIAHGNLEKLCGVAT